MRQCTNCLQVKPYSEFYTAPTKVGYRARCKVCMKSAVREYRKTKPQKNKPWQERTEVQRNWDKAHPEQARAKNKRHYETKRKFVPRDSNYVKGYVNRRRALKAGASGSHTVQEWKDLCAKCGNKCVWWGCNSSDLTRDHIIPLSRGGDDCIDNIQPLCRRHNSMKGTKIINIKEDMKQTTERVILDEVKRRFKEQWGFNLGLRYIKSGNQVQLWNADLGGKSSLTKEQTDWVTHEAETIAIYVILDTMM